MLGLLTAQVMLSAMAALLMRVSGVTPALQLHWIVFAAGVGFALLLALASAVPAACRAQRLSITGALAVR